MFRHPAFAKSVLMLVGLTAGSLVNAQAPRLTLSPAPPDPSTGTSKPDSAAMHCALSQYIPWVRAQSQPVGPQLKAAKLDEINKACGSTLHYSAADQPSSNAQTPTQAAPAASAANGPAFAELVDGPLADLEAYLSRPGIDINERKTNRETLLDIAADHNKALAAKLLLDHGADVEASPARDTLYHGNTALYHAAYMNSLDVAELLMARGASVDSRSDTFDSNTHTPLSAAASQGNLPMVAALLKHGAQVDAEFGVHQTPLSEALAHEHMDVVHVLTDHGAKLKPQYLATPALQGRVEATKLLLTLTIDQATKDDALRLAIIGGPEHSPERIQIVQDLLDHGANIDNLKSVPDVIPVMFATTPDMVEFLLAHGANERAKLTGAQIAKAFACNKASKDPIAMLQVLIARGIDISGPTTQGDAQYCASHANNPTLLAFLQEHHVGVSQTSAGATSVSGAAQPPNVIVTQSGKVTNMTVAGQLAAKNPIGCLPLNQLDNTRTPPDIYLGVSACIQKDDYPAAAALFALAGIESRFDAARVSDKSAGQAGQVLIMNTFNGMPQDKRDKFGKTVGDLAADPQTMANTCSAIRKIGHPDYYPEYMVLHGINAFTAKAGDATMEPNFDAQTTWNSLLTTYLTCHDGPTPVAAATPATPAKDASQPNDPNRMKPGLYQMQINLGDLVPTEKNTGPTYMRMCFTQAMIDRSNPVPQPGQCDRYQVNHNGNTTHTDFSCSKDGTKVTGRSAESINGNHRHSVIDMSTQDKEGTHAIHLVTDFIFLGPDCNTAYAAPPVPISVRHYRYESSLKGDGRNYQLNAEYQCRLEGEPTAAFNQLEWRLQGGMNRLKVVGKLPDGSAFKVQPVHLDWRSWDKNAGTCPDSTKTIDSEIWVTPAGSSSQVERFDRNHITSEHHHVQLIESRLVLDKTDTVPPGTPGLSPPPYVEDRPQYYSVVMTTVPAASVSNQKGLKEFTDQKRIPWLTAGQIYPFTVWGDDNVTFARNYTGMFTTEEDKGGGPGSLAQGIQTHDAFPSGTEWSIDTARHNTASQWLLMPNKTPDENAPRPDPTTLTKKWIVYNGARIEIPLFNYYRVLYDPARDEYLHFSINRRDAD